MHPQPTIIQTIELNNVTFAVYHHPEPDEVWVAEQRKDALENPFWQPVQDDSTVITVLAQVVRKMTL